MGEIVYKIVRGWEWAEAEKSGVFTGSADDKRDGFIHLSAAHQVGATFDRYFRDENNPWLILLDSERFGPALKWEVSRRGEKFPHLYGTFAVGDAEKVVAIDRDGDGRPIFPPEIA